MAQTLKLIGQSAPSATTETDLYTVPGATTTVVSSLVICNRSTATTFRVYVADAGAVTANKMYLYYDTPIGANDTFIATIGITLEATDVLRVYAGSANLSFNAFGAENT